MSVCRPDFRLSDLQRRPLVRSSCICYPCYHKEYKPNYELIKPDFKTNQRRHFENATKSTVFAAPDMPQREFARPEFSLEIYKRKRPYYLCGHPGELYWLDPPCKLKKALDYTHKCCVVKSSEEIPSALSPVRHRKEDTPSKREAKLIHRVSFSEACLPSTDSSTDEHSVTEEQDSNKDSGQGVRKGSQVKIKEPLGVEAAVPSDLKDKPEGYFLKHPIDTSSSASRLQDE